MAASPRPSRVEPGFALPRRDAEPVPGGARLCKAGPPNTPPGTAGVHPSCVWGGMLRHKLNQPQLSVEKPRTGDKGLGEKPTSGAARRAGRGVGGGLLGVGWAVLLSQGPRAQKLGWLHHCVSLAKTPLDGASSPRTAHGESCLRCQGVAVGLALSRSPPGCAAPPALQGTGPYWEPKTRQVSPV